MKLRTYLGSIILMILSLQVVAIFDPILKYIQRFLGGKSIKLRYNFEIKLLKNNKLYIKISKPFFFAFNTIIKLFFIL